MKKFLCLLFTFVLAANVFAENVADYRVAIENTFNKAALSKTVVMADNVYGYNNDYIELNLFEDTYVVYAAIEFDGNGWALIYIQYDSRDAADEVLISLMNETKTLKGNQKTIDKMLKLMTDSELSPITGKVDKRNIKVYTNVSLDNI